MQKIKSLGNIEFVDLRDCWEYEDKDFTPWLAQDDNIKSLGDAIDLDLEVESQEVNVGPFRADILCKDGFDHYVLIENQLEQTDHTHLGQIMTYAAGLNAATIVWIAKEFTEEHRAALDWLNNITDDSFNFFGIEIHLIKIGDSAVAPMFKVVAKPNGWSKAVRNTSSSVPKTNFQEKQIDYWTKLSEYVKGNKVFRMQKPLPQAWTNVAIGVSFANLSLGILKNGGIRVELWFNTASKDENKSHFDSIKSACEKRVDAKLVNVAWKRLDDKKSSYISVSADYNFLDASTHPAQFDWFKNTIITFFEIFQTELKKLK